MGTWVTRIRWTLAATLPPLPPPPAPDAAADGERAAVRASLALAGKRAEIAAAGENLGLQRTWLDAALGVEVQRDADDREWGAGPEAALDLPLADRGGAGRRAAAGALARALDDYRAQAVTLRAQVRLAQAQAESARRRAAYLAAVVIPLRQAIAAEVRTRVDAMLASAFDLLAAAADTLAAQRAELAARRDYWRSATALDALRAGAWVPIAGEGGGGGGGGIDLDAELPAAAAMAGMEAP
jgi:outer membrane protein TolC